MNVSDSEGLASCYLEKGWAEAGAINEADEIIINSCSVRESAENRVFGLVNNLTKLKRKDKKVKIILTGCMLRLPENLLRKKLPGVDEFRKITDWSITKRKNTKGKTAYLPIMNGCNNFCSYCVVPYSRGREVSRDLNEIICEAQELAERGYEEIVLLGQNVNSYGNDINNFKSIFKTKFKRPFAILLEVLNEIERIKKISFLTSNPWDLNDEIIEAMSLPKIDRFFHLPIQSGDDVILKKMNRKYTAKDYLKLIEKIKKRIPDLVFGTDIIVGFPGETEDQFNHTVNLCKKVGFKKAYVNIYSPRQGTAAFNLQEEIPFSEKRRRWKILDDLINQGVTS